MRISVIVPAYNAEKYLRETIDSVLGQSFADWELVIVNDGSRDSTEQIAREYSERDGRIRLVNRENGGVAAARNTGYQASSPHTEYICYLDNDDVWEPDALATFLSVLDANPDAIAVHALPRSIDGAGRPLAHDAIQAVCRERMCVQGKRLVRLLPDHPTTFGCFAVDNYIITPGISMLRRNALCAAGPWDESLSGFDDWDLWLRLCRQGEMIFLDRVVLQYRLHGNNLSSRSGLMARREHAFYTKVFHWPGETAERRDELVWGYRLRSHRMSQLRLTWARDCTRAGKPLQALKQLHHALANYWHFAVGPRQYL